MRREGEDSTIDRLRPAQQSRLNNGTSRKRDLDRSVLNFFHGINNSISNFRLPVARLCLVIYSAPGTSGHFPVAWRDA